MTPIRVLVLRAAGTNCDLETQHAWEVAGAAVERVHVRRLSERLGLLDDFQVLTIPGGFSYGDDIAAGRILARQLERHLLDRIREFIGAVKLVLGICNGFQVLVRTGLLPFAAAGGGQACTIAPNEPPGFQDRWTWLEAGQTPCAFLEPGRRYEMPIAHGEGRVVFADDAADARAMGQGHAALRYIGPPGGVHTAGLPDNPNGSQHDLAGLCDETGHVLGLMPHPERFITWTQHPEWTSQPAREPGDGLALFQRAVSYFK
ncbi:MAG: phosphoribosylformylglycinamidine synthase subunit PurQ [Phycisphaerae bacterium]|nr:phosphoribosylformylglycinamidine synthase subunit PurQ [Phycisphaerae bacterium]